MMELNHTYNEPRLKSTKKSPQIGSFTSVACALVTDVSDEWWKIEIARFFVPPFVKILISHSWIMRQLDSWRRIISSSIDHLSSIFKWKVTNSFLHAPNIHKKIHNVTKYFYCYTGATRTTKSNQLSIYNPSNKLSILPDSSFQVFKVLLRQIVSITLCKIRPWQGFQLQNRIMRGLM